MTLYRYRAMDKDGKIRNGNLDAVNDSDLDQRLSRMGMDLIRADITEEKRASLTERQKQVILAKRRGESHIGEKQKKVSA